MTALNPIPSTWKDNTPIIIIWWEEKPFPQISVDSILNQNQPIVEKKKLCKISDLQALTSLKDLDLFMIIAESTKTLWITRNPILFLAYRLFKDGISEDEIFREVNLLLIQLEDWNVDNILDNLEKRFNNKT